MAKKTDNKEFDCPSCGNPLRRSNNNTIICCYCKTRIVPQGYGEKRNQEPKIYEKRGRRR